MTAAGRACPLSWNIWITVVKCSQFISGSAGAAHSTVQSSPAQPACRLHACLSCGWGISGTDWSTLQRSGCACGPIQSLDETNRNGESKGGHHAGKIQGSAVTQSTGYTSQRKRTRTECGLRPHDRPVQACLGSHKCWEAQMQRQLQ